MSFQNTGQLLTLGDATASYAGGLDINGMVEEENGTMTAGSLASDPGQSGILGLINATFNEAGPMWDPDTLVGLMGNSHLLLLAPQQFMSPVVIADAQATVQVHNIKDFAGISFDAKTSMVDFVSNSNVVEASLRVYNEVPNTSWSAVFSTDPTSGGENVTLGLHQNIG